MNRTLGFRASGPLVMGSEPNPSLAQRRVGFGLCVAERSDQGRRVRLLTLGTRGGWATIVEAPNSESLVRRGIQAIFIKFKSIPAVMATSDHVPEVCFQVSILQVPAATLYFFSSQFYFIRFLGNKERNLDSIRCCFHCLFPWSYG